ncbi:MAG: ABC transporter substrate-binding protein [Acidimicrobiaceae bacterium]|nr:ABC transporter substrate-binding protein [Acidimicrobiaceae bacterium]
MGDQLSRRNFLQRGVQTIGGLAVLGVGAPLLLEAGVASAKTAASVPAGLTAKSFGTLQFMGSWVPDVETGGEYVALSRNYWGKQGFSSANVIPGGPNATPQETMVQTGKAFVAVSSLDATAAAIEKGFEIVVIGAQYQKNPFAIMSAASKPLHTPRDMIGKKIGVQSDNDSVWAAFLKANHIDPAKVHKVPVGFDPTPLTQGTVDGWFSFITNEPIELRLKGFKTTTFLLADFNYPEVGNVYIVTKNSLKTARNKVKAAMIGDILGWKGALTDPQLAARLSVAKGQGLTMRAELLQAYAQSKLIATGDALTHGLFYVTRKAAAANVKTLALGGIKATPSRLFDMSLLEEIYTDAEMKTVPKPVTS